MAFANLTAQGRGTAAEFQSILEKRGAKLPALQSSPNEKPASASTVIQGGSSRELIQELRRENEEIKRLKAQLQQSGNEIVPRQQAAPAVKEEAYSDKKAEIDGETLPALNILGIFAAAALGGYVTLQKKDADLAQAAYEETLRAEQGVVTGLRADVTNIQNLLNEEKSLVEKMKRESATATAEYSRQLSLEKAAKEAVEQERRLVEQSLSSEQRLAEALRNEAEKTSELLEAEKAAKFAADAEAQELKSQLDQVQQALAEEKLQVQKWIDETKQANERLTKAQDINSALENSNAALEEDIQARQARIEELNAAAEALQQQIMSADAVNESQNLLIERIGKDTLSMKEAMSVMRAQAAERALAAQAAAEEAIKEREQYESEAMKFRDQIAQQQSTINSLEAEIASAKEEIKRANEELQQTKEDLVNAQKTMQSMEENIQCLTDKLVAAESSLGEEKEASSMMRADNVNLRAELASLQSDLSKISSDLASEREEKDQILNAMESLKEDYNLMSERVEAEQNTVAALRKEAAELKRTISDLETKNKTLGSNMIQVEEQSRGKLADVERRLAEAEKNAITAQSSKQDAVAAIDKLENVIRMLQEDMQESQEFAMSAQKELEAERLARSDAEASLDAMQRELQSIASMEEQAREDVQSQLVELRNEYEAAMSKLQELQMAKTKPKAKRVSAPKKELTEEEKEAKKRAAVEKRKATIARKKAEAAAQAKEESIKASE